MEKSSSSSESRTVEITVSSAEDLRINGRSVVKNAFAIVKLDPCNYHVTKIDALGGSYPAWDQKLVMKLPMHVSVITLEVHCKTSSLGDRLVGRATFPVSDFVGGYVPENQLNFLSYLLRDGRGIKNGIINVSVRVMIPELKPKGESRKGPRYECSSSSSSQPMLGIPVLVGEMNFNGGISVWNHNNV